MKRPVRQLILLSAWFVIAVGSVSAEGLNFAGDWAGYWERGAERLAVTVRFAETASGISGSFSSDQLRVVGVPFAEVKLAGRTLSWKLVGDSTTTEFSGRLMNNQLVGRFREGTSKGLFRLRRKAIEEARQPERELEVVSKSVRLSGTLVLPPGRGPFPCIVFIHGSGPEGRWANRYLAYRFASRGIAGFIYDKRGVGQSGGDWKAAGFDVLADDVLTVIDALRRERDIDPERIGIHGHSQGGTIAPLVAAKDGKLAFVVASSGIGVSMAEAERFSLANSLGINGLPEAQRKEARNFVDAIVATGYEGAPRRGLDDVARELKGRSWYFDPPVESDFYWDFAKRIAGFDALGFWAQVQAPSLLVYGEGDERVPALKSIRNIRRAVGVKEGERLKVILFPRADHNFRLKSASERKVSWPRSAAGYPEKMLNWVVEKVAK